MDIYRTPKSNLDLEKIGAPPKLAYALLSLFFFEFFSVIAINLMGSYGNEPIHLFSIEMAIVFAASLFLMAYVWKIIKEGLKTISIVVYVFLAISIIFDGPNWVSSGIFFGVAESLTFINFSLLLCALYMAKLPLKKWFIR